MQDSKSSAFVERERRLIPWLLPLLVTCSFTGLITYFYPSHDTWQQLTFIFHTITGFLLAFILLCYLFFHFRRTLAIRHPMQVFLGIISALILLLLIASGLHIGIVGQYESLRWVYWSHVYASFIVLVTLVLHIVLNGFNQRRRNPRKQDHTFWAMTISYRSLKLSVVSVISMIIVTYVMQQVYESGFDEIEHVSSSYEYPYGASPFLPSQAETVSGSFVSIKKIGNSKRCESCHEELTRQWRSSMHGRAASDPVFQKNIHSLIENKGMPAARYCSGCHVPVGLLSGITNSGTDYSQGQHIDEGVSCMGCHGIKDVIHLKGVGSYMLDVEKDYLFSSSDSTILQWLHDYILKINPRQHRLDMGQDILSDPKVCATCHEQYIDKDLNDWGWVQLQRQYISWLNGPFSKQNQQNFSNSDVVRCQDCHFPLKKSNDPSANLKGMVRSHTTPGANTAIPWLLGDKEQYELVKAFMQDDRLRLTIQQSDEEIYSAGSDAEISISINSRRIGHNFPAGTIDLNEPWIYFHVQDSTGEVIFESGALDETGKVDPEANFYYSILVNRQGKHVWKHDLFNAVWETHVNLIPPGGSDTKRYKFNIPVSASSPLTIKAVLRYRKFNNKYARWALGDNMTDLPVVDMAKDEIKIDLLGEL